MGIRLEFFVSLEMAICMAWRHRSQESSSCVRMTTPAPLILNAQHLKWADEESGEELPEIIGEKWAAIFDWRCGVVNCPSGYSISGHGRLRNQTGKITAGHWYNLLDTRVAAVKGCGLVDLLICARIKQNIVYLQPAIKQAADALISGHTPTDLADMAGIETSSGWSYFTRAAMHIHSSDLLRCVPGIVSADLWEFLSEMREDGDAALGGKLNELLPIVDAALVGKPRGEFIRSENKMGQLRLAQMAI